jgi:hypothetical protein
MPFLLTILYFTSYVLTIVTCLSYGTPALATYVLTVIPLYATSHYGSLHVRPILYLYMLSSIVPRPIPCPVYYLTVIPLSYFARYTLSTY